MVISQFRQMEIMDIDRIIDVEKKIYGHPWTTGIFRDCIGVGYDCWVLADEQIEAYGIMSIGAEEAHILNVSVAPQYQRQGRAQRLLRHFIQIARKKNADTVFLEVRPSNEVAIHIYRKFGFVEAGIRKNYYPADFGREDALVLARSLLV